MVEIWFVWYEYTVIFICGKLTNILEGARENGKLLVRR